MMMMMMMTMMMIMTIVMMMLMMMIVMRVRVDSDDDDDEMLLMLMMLMMPTMMTMLMLTRFRSTELSLSLILYFPVTIRTTCWRAFPNSRPPTWRSDSNSPLTITTAAVARLLPVAEWTGRDSWCRIGVTGIAFRIFRLRRW